VTGGNDIVGYKARETAAIDAEIEPGPVVGVIEKRVRAGYGNGESGLRLEDKVIVVTHGQTDNLRAKSAGPAGDAVVLSARVRVRIGDGEIEGCATDDTIGIGQAFDLGASGAIRGDAPLSMSRKWNSDSEKDCEEAGQETDDCFHVKRALMAWVWSRAFGFRVAGAILVGDEAFISLTYRKIIPE
jgi:hypothetical protein